MKREGDILGMEYAVRIVLTAFMLLSGSACWGSDSIEPVPIPIEPDLIDLNGQWLYTRSGASVSGMCPAGNPASGTISIAQTGSQVSLNIVSGSVCDPGSVCQFSGALDENQLVVGNSPTVDEEGGKVTNTMSLVVMANDSMHGTSTSTYVHPKGFACSWSSQVTLSRTSGSEQTDPGETAGGDTGTSDGYDEPVDQSDSGDTGESSTDTGDTESAEGQDDAGDQGDSGDTGESSTDTGDTESSEGSDGAGDQGDSGDTGENSTDTGDTESSEGSDDAWNQGDSGDTSEGSTDTGGTESSDGSVESGEQGGTGDGGESSTDSGNTGSSDGSGEPGGQGEAGDTGESSTDAGDTGSTSTETSGPGDFFNSILDKVGF